MHLQANCTMVGRTDFMKSEKVYFFLFFGKKNELE